MTGLTIDRTILNWEYRWTGQVCTRGSTKVYEQREEQNLDDTVRSVCERER